MILKLLFFKRFSVKLGTVISRRSLSVWRQPRLHRQPKPRRLFTFRRVLLYPLLAGSAFLYLDDRLNWQRVRRNLRAAFTCARIIYEYKFNWSETKPNADLHRRCAKLILNTCQKNGGLYIKFGQGIASMNHLLPEQYNEVFQVLHDSAPVADYDAVRQIIAEDLNIDAQFIFAEFDEQPVASASIAQVHKARLHSGEWVAVKIQKPEIPAQVPWDLFFYRILLYSFEYAFDLPLVWSADFTDKQLTTEIDFVNEAMNAQKTKQLLRHDEYIFNYDYHREEGSEFYNAFIDNRHLRDKVYVPKIYPQLCSSRILTAEWCDGCKANDVAAINKLFEKNKSRDWLSEIMHSIVSLFGYQIFVTGVLHCDPHPGNILVRRHPTSRKLDYQLVFLDHGLYIEEPPLFKQQYSRFWCAIFEHDTETMREIGERWGVGDVDFFASMQIIRPFSAEHGVNKQKLSSEEMARLHSEAKSRVQNILMHTQSIPRHLVFVGRNMNLVRANNKDLGSVVDRVHVLAEYAAQGAQLKQKRGYLYYLKYQLNTHLISLYCSWNSLWGQSEDEQIAKFAEEIGFNFN